METMWQEFSKEMAGAVEHAGKSLVAITGTSGQTSSGIVWRPDTILTAAHAVRGEVHIRVIPAPGKSVSARVAGRDRGSDIAVLKLEQPIDLALAEFGSTDPLAVGQITVAVARTRRGNIVASAGIISGLMGEWQIHRTRIDQFIRPDLTLYNGFSGGALVGAGGTVFGMNTSALIRGKAITIPASTLTRIAGELAATGDLARPYIGLVMQPVQIPESLQAKAGVKAAAGLLVMHVEPAGPADLAGVLLGDVLLEIDGSAFDDLDDVGEVLGRRGSGNEVQATLIRGGEKLQLPIRVGVRPPRRE